MAKTIAVLFVLITAAVIFFIADKKSEETTSPQPTNFQENTTDLSQEPALTVFASNLTVPWGMESLPDGRIVFTERPGRVKIIERDGSITQIAEIDVYATGESGLHGIAIDPDFIENNNIFIYYTYRSAGNNTMNRVSRFTLDDNSLIDEEVMVDEIPGAQNHDGGRIKFGPDGYLYITTGDAQEPSRAQDRDSLAGKILRVTKNGEDAPGNPFNNSVYSYGHRNSQGITWDSEGNLWATEHGRSGVLSGLDELNLIEIGNNYGWPEIEGDEQINDMEAPVVNSGASTTWAPGGAAYYDGSIFFTGLRGQTLYEYKINEKTVLEHLSRNFGRLRDVIVGKDGFLYITTSNRDGRGNPAEDDDRILRINPQKINEL